MLVFSSAEITNLSERSLRPFQTRWSRSRIRPALTPTPGARRQIQHRCCQGRMASSLSHLQMVGLLRVARRPERRTCEPSSARLHRESGSPSFAGSSQAMALTRTTSSGGEDPGPSGSWAVIETTEALLEEAVAPQADDLAPCGEVVCDSAVGVARGSRQSHLGADYMILRECRDDGL